MDQYYKDNDYPKKIQRRIFTIWRKRKRRISKKRETKAELKDKALPQQLASRKQHYESPKYLKQSPVQKYYY
jgi:hypothetical protein